MDKFNTEQLIQALDDLKTEIIDGKVDLDIQQDIWNLFFDKAQDNKKLINYLFLGWWIYQLNNTNL
jgi:hypothetical protein